MAILKYKNFKDINNWVEADKVNELIDYLITEFLDNGYIINGRNSHPKDGSYYIQICKTITDLTEHRLFTSEEMFDHIENVGTAKMKDLFARLESRLAEINFGIKYNMAMNFGTSGVPGASNIYIKMYIKKEEENELD